MVLKLIIAHKANLVLPPIFNPLVPLELEIVTPFWAMSIVLAHLIPSFALEKFVV
jgi:hypothetical protein